VPTNEHQASLLFQPTNEPISATAGHIHEIPAKNPSERKSPFADTRPVVYIFHQLVQLSVARSLTFALIMSVPFIRQGYYPKDDDYYVLLDVDFNASQETIASAYRNLARKFHPDKHLDERSKKEAELLFHKIKTAYDVLGDPRKRQIYDTLGPEGLKIDGWQLTRKQMTADEIREEFKRIQKQREEEKMAITAKPRASFTVSIDASELFRQTYPEETTAGLDIDALSDASQGGEEDDDDDDDEEDDDEEEDDDDGDNGDNTDEGGGRKEGINEDDETEDSGFESGDRSEDDEAKEVEVMTLSELLYPYSAIELRALSTNMSVENPIGLNHTVTLTGSLSVQNGVGEGTVGAVYRYKYSQYTQYSCLYQTGRMPICSIGVDHKLSDKTSVSCRGMCVIDPYYYVPAFKLSLTHKIRNYLLGKITYREGINPSMTTSLIYINEKLMLEVTTSYKLTQLHQSVSIDLGYRFNNDESKLSVSLVGSEKEGLAVEYGCETRVFSINAIGASLALSIPAGVTLKLRYNRANQEFVVPIYLSDEVHSAPVFYGTVVPLVAFYIAHHCYFRHHAKQSK
jgi:curved DNA-binding protein CbpA